MNPQLVARARLLALATGLEDRVSFDVDDSSRLPRAAFQLITVARLPGDPGWSPASLGPRIDRGRVMNAIRNAMVADGACPLLEPPGPVSLVAASLETLARRAGFSRIRRLGADGRPRLYELRR